MCVLWSLFTEPAIVWLGFDAETAALGHSYALPYNVYHMILGIDLCLKTLMACTTDREYTSLAMQIGQQASHVLVIVIMTWHPFGIQTTSLVWIGWAQVIIGLMVTMTNYAVAIQRGWLDEYWEGFVKTAAWKVCYTFFLLSMYVEPSREVPKLWSSVLTHQRSISTNSFSRSQYKLYRTNVPYPTCYVLLFP
jgi:hypothetical protein